MKYVQRSNKKLTLGLLESGAVMTDETRNVEIDPSNADMTSRILLKFDYKTGNAQVNGMSREININKDCASIWFGANTQGFDTLVCIPQKSNRTIVILYQLSGTFSSKKSKRC